MTLDEARITDQLTAYCDNELWPGLVGLSDEEYLWEPVVGCWSLRPAPDGTHTVDWALPPPDPPPVTTIAWRLAFVVTNLATRAHHHFDAAPFSPDTHDWPATASGGVALLRETVRDWCRCVRGLDPSELSRAAGPSEGVHQGHSLAAMLLNANCQVIHHGGAMLLQRSLWSARAAS
ncbi:hypothetical protein F4561_003083 [Lipingzhangella halophila]|uniref:DinB-like domain-containing protein n=1 Tax=Lipingzhangella halophila TaxID=1783352 RepID=A0A7W7W398_9ACTN|nr:DinB family protein [Lipingzhangella halophila]MBB4932263.1 hypothetical protein [Lipingzhangella halophila]